MLKTTLYSAVAGGLLAAATIATPVNAAPAAPKAEVQKNATDVQYHHCRRHHRHRHHHGYYYQPYGYYAPQPGVGIYLRTW